MGDCAHLCPYLQYILECHARVGQLALEEHYDVVVVLVKLLSFRRLGPLRIALLDVRLKRRYLFIDIRNILFDYEGEFLTRIKLGTDAFRAHTRTLISTGRSSNKVFRFATVIHISSSAGCGRRYTDAVQVFPV